MKFDSDDLAICVTCGTQFDVAVSEAPATCRICDDPRQYVPLHGQTWTTLAEAQGNQTNTFEQSSDNSNIWFITTSPKSANFNPLNTAPTWSKDKQLGIGERAILLTTPAGNVLWDLIAYLDQDTVDFVKGKGGLKAIVISHPHFYTTHLEWARIFSCPVYVSAADEEWLNRKDGYGLRRLVSSATEEIVPGVTMIRTGGHFDGSCVLHWDGQLFIADSFMTVPSAYYHASRLPGTTSYSFMWSYPNMIPLPPAKIHGIWQALKPFDFTATYGGFTGQNNRRPDLKKQVLESMKIFVRTAGHADAEVLREEV
ncbi:hypothetical protein K491DRAFT_3458 [Lophiostoma macrostomum CBS 122681]|uniref:Metallo-beta-lactamase domain-containing protein n=1 Tax=Lophiostoma macrostomum CBS 122681 TaxID=1314788 RepID=A0A6A6TU31_9PLEO|nr:hypothetical protein K491DRAFT_3458 [Lophiostoma macrostomum CBS 122681]